MFSHDLGDGAELRMLEPRHADEFLEFVAANRDYLADWLDWASRIETAEQAREFLQGSTKRLTEDGLPWIGIWQDGEMAGGILFFPVDWRIRSTEVGYWLGGQSAGRGLMTRALVAALDFVFGEIELHRVGLQAAVENLRSRAVAERLGFTQEGVLRHAWRVGGRYVDHAQYSMLASEWPEKRPASGT